MNRRRVIQTLAGLAAPVGSILLSPLRTVKIGEQPVATPPDVHAHNTIEQKIWDLLDDIKSVYVTLPEADFKALGEGFALPESGNTVTELAIKAPGGAFDPRDLTAIPAATLGYKADWIVERYKRYNLDWDITGLRLTSLDPEAKKYPWLIIINGGAANFYEFYVDLKNRPGWCHCLAQMLNVLIIESENAPDQRVLSSDPVHQLL